MTIFPDVLLFIFAHQDDEFGVFQCIQQARQSGLRVCCAYLTDGGLHSLPKRRNRESLNVLSKLGVNSSDVFFAGEALKIKDGSFVQHLDLAATWLKNWFATYSTIKSIYIPAWEGGHHDHDALHAVTLFVTQKIGMLHIVRQFPLYNNYACMGKMFRVFAPLVENGEIYEQKIPWRNRFHFICMCLAYPSQFKSWVGLFPFVVLHYLRCGVELSQPVSLERLSSRPHIGQLYYEKRNFTSWEKMSHYIDTWQKS